LVNSRSPALCDGGGAWYEENVAWQKQYLKFQRSIGMFAANAMKQFFVGGGSRKPYAPKIFAPTADEK
jgi:hypothetical protein